MISAISNDENHELRCGEPPTAALTADAFARWMVDYGRTGAENDPQASAALFAPEASYHESPFDAPLVGRDAIYDYWLQASHRLRDKESTFEILAVEGQRGIARWRSTFAHIETGQRYVLDCVFAVDFNETGLCRLFREWWHIQEAPSSR